MVPATAIWKVCRSDQNTASRRSVDGGNIWLPSRPSAGRPRMSFSSDTPLFAKLESTKAAAAISRTNVRMRGRSRRAGMA